MNNKTPTISVVVLLLLQSCSQSGLPTANQSSGTAALYINEVHKLDSPDYAMQQSTTPSLSKLRAGLGARFTNADHSRLLSTEINYFDGGIDSLGVYQYTADQLTRITWYNNPGTDGIWQTTDDAVSSYHDHAPASPDVIYTIYRGAGSDQSWFTNDDDILYYYKPVLDASGATVGIGAFTLPGDDDTWFTDDDFIGWLKTENTTGNATQWVMYLSAGTDNDWLTLDDNQAYRFALTELDANGQRQRHSYFQGVGLDGLLFTNDDDLIYYHDYSFDDQSRIAQTIMYSGVGSDGLWYTADDIVHSCKVQTRDVNDLPTRTTSYRPGPDQSCFTSDDVIWGYHDDAFDSANLLIQSDSYYLPGADNTWFSLDDVLIYSRTYR